MSTISHRRPFLLSFAVLGTSSVVALSLCLSDLSHRYPISTPSPSSPVFHSTRPNQRIEQSDLFVVRLPLASVLPSPSSPYPSPDNVTDTRLHSLVSTFTHAFFSTPLITLESRIIALFKTGIPRADVLPRTPFVERQPLVNGALRVASLPEVVSSAMTDGDGEKREFGRMVVGWEVPSPAVRFFECLAALGVPYRLMNGGRHVFEVERLPARLSEGEGEEEEIELRFACGVDFERTGGREEGKDDGKSMPGVVGWGHVMYARALLDQAVRKMRVEASR